MKRTEGLRLKWILSGLCLWILLLAGSCEIKAQVHVDSSFVYKCAEWKAKAIVYEQQRDSLITVITDCDRPKTLLYVGLGYAGGILTAITIKLLAR